MRSPAAAIGWELTNRQRWVLLAIPIYLLALGIVKRVVLGPDETADVFDGLGAFAVAPFSVAFFYFVAVFSFGFNGDLAARQSIFPARYFSLPVPTAVLARWPMAYGAIVMMLLWLLGSSVARWGLGMRLPWLWPGFLMAAVLAWIQVFSWMPYGLRGVRVIAAVTALILLDAVVITAIELKVSEVALILFLAPQLPLAYLGACAALARARRGHVPDWSLAGNTRRSGARTLRPFAAANRAQFWFEWRRHGQSLPTLVGILVPFELSMLFISGYGSQWFVFEVLTSILLTPVVMAAFAGATVSTANPFARDVYGVSPFNATKPITSAAMITAKLQMALWSTLAAWSVLLVVSAIGFRWSGADSVLIGWADRFVAQVGLPRAIVATLVILGGLITFTWTVFVQGLCIGLTGRQWLVRTIGMITLVFFMTIGPVIESIAESTAALRWLWDYWTIVPAILVVLKVTIAIAVAKRLSRSALISDRTLVIGAGCWAASVFTLYLVLIWWADTSLLPRYLFLSLAILAVPLVRISAAPLALDWNRHR
jgi:hypothetical protein